MLLPRTGLVPGRLAGPRMVALVAVTVVDLARRQQRPSPSPSSSPSSAASPSASPAPLTARSSSPCWVWAWSGVLLVVTAAEPLLERVQPRTEALQLPGFTPARRSAAARLLVPLALGLLPALAVVALAGGSAAWFAAAAVLQTLVEGAAAAAAVRAYRGRGRRARALRSALEAYGPELVLHTARAGALYQVQMWLPQLEQLGRRYLILTREPAALPGLAALTGAPVVARTTWRELDDAVVPSLRVAVYVNSVAANADFVTYRQLVHVYLGHGESDKALSYHPGHAQYDRIFVAGQAAVERYAANRVTIPPEKFVVVGRPQSAALLRANRPVGQLPAPTVLYAPTWAGYNQATSHSSLPRGVEIVAALLRRPGAVAFRPHPFSRERPAEREQVAAVEAVLARDAARTGRAHLFGEATRAQTFAETANAADAMVADVSSVLVEFLASDKPMAVVAAGERLERFRERHPVAAAAYLVDGDLGNLDAVLDDLLGTDPLRPERERVLRHYVGTADPAEAFRAALTGLLDGGPQAAG